VTPSVRSFPYMNIMTRSFRVGSLAAGSLAAALTLAGCTSGTILDPFSQPPSTGLYTKTALDLSAMPVLTQAIPISVYEFPDLTGAHKPSDKFAEFSRAVTQGGLPILVDALKTACESKCFRVIERAGLKNLLQERQIIQATRAEHHASTKLPPLLFAGVVIEGGIVGYDTNQVTGGAGARYLGIGGDVKQRQDVVTIGLRLISVQTGEVLRSVTTSKTIYSVAVQGSAFRYAALDSLLEVEVGVTRNEPPQLAVREAIELAVYSIIMEGALSKSWAFADQAAGRAALELYRKRKLQKTNELPEAPELTASLPAQTDPVTATAVDQGKTR
jgi:curli production assembly/transport component CsgG